MDIDNEPSATKGEDEVTWLQRFQVEIANILKWFTIALFSDRRECGKRRTKVAYSGLLAPLNFTPHPTIMTQEAEHYKTKYGHIHVNSRKHPSLGGFSLCKPLVY
jgi:hypothetical protein